MIGLGSNKNNDVDRTLSNACLFKILTSRKVEKPFCLFPPHFMLWIHRSHQHRLYSSVYSANTANLTHAVWISFHFWSEDFEAWGSSDSGLFCVVRGLVFVWKSQKVHSAHVVYAGGCGGWKSCVAAAVLGSFPFCALRALYPHLV